MPGSRSYRSSSLSTVSSAAPSSVYSSGRASSAYSTFNSSQPWKDRSLNFANINRGNVAALRSQFASPATTSAGYSRQRIGSVDRYTRSAPNDRLSVGNSNRSSFSPANSYITSAPSRRIYAPPASNTNSTNNLAPSALGITYNKTSPTSRVSGKDSSQERVKNTTYNLTPFSSRRNSGNNTSPAKSSTYNLTPFSSRLNRSEIKDLSNQERKKSKLTPDESIDQESEEEDERNFVRRMCRATSPLEPHDPTVRYRSKPISATKTIKVKIKRKGRRIERKFVNAGVQIDVDELKNNIKYSRFLHGPGYLPNRRLPSLRIEPETTPPNLSSPTLSPRKVLDRWQPKPVSAPTTPVKVKLPSQSSYKIKQRPKNDQSLATGGGEAPAEMKFTIEGTSATEDESVFEEPIPQKQQTSYLLRKQAQEAAAVAPLTPENLSLKDSIEKVKQWKQQLQITPPDAPSSSRPPKIPKVPRQNYKKSDEKKVAEDNASSAPSDLISTRPMSPYDNMQRRSPSPYDNLDQRKSSLFGLRNRILTAPSVDSLLTYGPTTEDRGSTMSLTSIGNDRPKRSTFWGVRSVENLSGSILSLPDLARPEQMKKGFISSLIDIDSILGYSDTERDFSDEEQFLDNITPRISPPPEFIYISNLKDIDDVIGSLKFNEKRLITSSCDSLLDTPIAENTPDQPLLPSPSSNALEDIDALLDSISKEPKRSTKKVIITDDPEKPLIDLGVDNKPLVNGRELQTTKDRQIFKSIVRKKIDENKGHLSGEEIVKFSKISQKIPEGNTKFLGYKSFQKLLEGINLDTYKVRPTLILFYASTNSAYGYITLTRCR